MPDSSTLFAIACACCALVSPLPTVAGEFSVNPIRLELGASVRSSSITVRNDGKQKLNFQIEAREWTQDESGKDQYGPTRDLVFFPKIMAVEAEQESVIRVGIRNAVLPTEKTYRLFIEELPPAQPAPGVQLNVVIRFGAPVFVQPLKPQDGLEIEALTLAGGALSFRARNTGNRHQVIQGIQLRGYDDAAREVYALSLADRYLLAGSGKPYTAAIDAERCSKLAVLEVDIKTDKSAAQRKLGVTRAMCP